MSDPLSVVASIAGLIGISAKIISMLKGVYDCGAKAKGAPESISCVIDEMQDMNVIFCEVQLFVIGQSKSRQQNRLTMISVHHLIATLSGGVLVCSSLDKYLSEVVGIVDPSVPAGKAGLMCERVKWAAWKEAQVTEVIEDLQRHKLSLNLMLGIIQCHTAAEATESLGKLHEIMAQILDSNHVISVQLRGLIAHQSNGSTYASSVNPTSEFGVANLAFRPIPDDTA
ncbi:hypothetical protein BZA05DRAFT_97186 [Tricharina praecox]|uniref:uncharacterized protein n=1 Tax=Tricharina praecox TaxID=43433 RepID=UPI002220F95B|nr:uncharacterized protein BZA05DRAFT_97186 [Tricharina praecox]KAI5848412.1 hypothetical protein BZA05DRAFT_97186 [Tricharina praecox]